MRINTDGKKRYRSDLYERTAGNLGEKTKTGGIDLACMHVNSDLDNKREALDFLAERLTAAELEKVAEILTTDQIPLSVSVETEVGP